MEANTFTLSFRLVCLISTGALLIFCSWKFNRNENTSLVDFQNYNDKEKDIYPSFTICFGIYDELEGLYDKKKLKETYNIQNWKGYIRFLRGEEWDKEMLKIDYDDVTMHLKDYVTTISVHVNDTFSNPVYKWISNDTNSNNEKSAKERDNFPCYTSFRHKCFSCDLTENSFPGIKKDMISMFDIAFKKKKLPNVMLGYFMHYPNQFIRSPVLDLEWQTNPGIKTGDYKAFWIDTIDVVRRRNTNKNPCNKILIYM